MKKATNKTLVEQFVEDPDQMRLYQQERAIYEVTELLESRMKERKVTRSELAKRLGKTRSWITQLLDGDANKTIRTVADVFAALGEEFHSFSQPIRISNETTVGNAEPVEEAPEEPKGHSPAVSAISGRIASALQSGAERHSQQDETQRPARSARQSHAEPRKTRRSSHTEEPPRPAAESKALLEIISSALDQISPADLKDLRRRISSVLRQTRTNNQ